MSDLMGGPCPVCRNTVAGSADTCPSCGNRDFWVPIGTPYRDSCYWCWGKGKGDDYNDCLWCGGTGRAKYHLCEDPRTGKRQGFMYDAGNDLAKDTYVGQVK